MQDLESGEPQKVFTANTGFPWALLLKILLGALLIVNLCTVAVFSMQTPELVPKPDRSFTKKMGPYPDTSPPASYTTNVKEGQLYSAVCELVEFLMVYDYKLRACENDGFWDDFEKYDPATLYTIGTVLTTVSVLVIVFLYYRYPKLLTCLCILGAIIFISFMVVVGRNNMPSRGGDSLSILHTFVNPHVNFIDYRAMLGTFIGAKLSKQTYSIEPHPIYFDKITQMVNENDLSSTVEQSNLCINNGMEDTKDYVIHLEEVDRNKFKVESEEDITEKVSCVTLPDFISFNKIAPPLFISFDGGERTESLTTIASWKPWIEDLDATEGVVKPLFYVAVYLTEGDSEELKQAVCDVLNSFDMVFIDHYSVRVTLPLKPSTLCSSCRYILADQEMLDFYRINTKAHDSLPPSGDTQSHDSHDHAGHNH